MPSYPIECLKQMRDLKRSIFYQEYTSEMATRYKEKFDGKHKFNSAVILIDFFNDQVTIYFIITICKLKGLLMPSCIMIHFLIYYSYYS